MVALLNNGLQQVGSPLQATLISQNSLI